MSFQSPGLVHRFIELIICRRHIIDTSVTSVIMTVAEGNVGLAIGLVCGAGAATAIGASAVFFPSIVKLASRRVLAGSLGLSAGVMTYVSFVEIFFKAVDAFGPDNAGFDDDKAFNLATLTFFCGIVFMKVSDTIYCSPPLNSHFFTLCFSRHLSPSYIVQYYYLSL